MPVVGVLSGLQINGGFDMRTQQATPPWMVLENIRQQCMQNEPIAALRSMVMDLDYENWIRQNCSSDEIAAKRMGNVWFLLDALKTTMDRDETGETTFEDAIAKLVLRDMLERQEEEEDADRVQLMTMHASKGLQFDVVVLPDLSDSMTGRR